MKKIALALVTCLAWAGAAFAQVVPPGTNPVPGAGAYNSSPPTCQNGQFCMLQTDVNGQLKVAGTIAATIAGFTPGGTFATLTATGSSASVALPAGAVVAIQNTGTTAVSCTLGVGSATAVVNQLQVQPTGTIFVTVGSNTFGACIDQTGSASNLVVLAGGAGIGTGFGGGGSSGGGGGAVTIADGADVTQGAIADAAATAGSTGTQAAKLRLMTTQLSTLNTSLGTINTTLGSPFQAGASIGNTSFAATQSGAWNITNITGTITLPSLASTSTKQSDGSQKTQIVDGSGNVVAATSNNLNVQCANCSGSGVSTADEASFTAGTSLFAGTGGFFQTTATSNALTNGQQGMWQMTANRAGFVNLRTSAGVETGVAAAPLQVSLANTAANATAVKVDGSAVTQPVSAASLPLPTGASTSALQPSNSAIGATTAAQTGTLAMGATTTGAPTYTTAQTNPLSLTTGGALRTDSSGSTQPISGTVTANQGGAPWTVTGTGSAGTAATGVITVQGIASMTKLLVTPDSVALPANQSVNVAQINGVTPLMGNGATGTGSPRVTIVSDGTAISTAGYMSVKIDQTTPGTTNNVTAASNTAPVSTMNSASASAGVNSALAGVFDDTSPTAITENNFGFLRMSANRNLYGTLRDAAGNERGVNVDAANRLAVGVVAAATGGSTTAGAIQPNNTTAVVVKASAGTLLGIQAYNIGAGPAYLKIYNATSATCGSGTPVKRLLIPKAGTAADGAGNNITFTATGVNFATGITYCITTGIADNDATAAATNTVLVNVDYQ